MKLFKLTFLVMISRLVAAVLAIILFNYLNSDFEPAVLDQYYFIISQTGLVSALCVGSIFQITSLLQLEKPELLPQVRAYAVVGLTAGMILLTVYLVLLGVAELVFLSCGLLCALVISNYLLGVARARSEFSKSQISHALVSQLAPLTLLLLINDVFYFENSYHPLVLFVLGQLIVVWILVFQLRLSSLSLTLQIARLPRERESSIWFLNANAFFGFASTQIPYIVFPFVASDLSISNYYFVDRVVMFGIMAANIYDSASINNYVKEDITNKISLFINDLIRYFGVGLVIIFVLFFSLEATIEILSLGKITISKPSVVAICIYVLFKFLMGPFMSFYTTSSRSSDVLFLNVFFVMVAIIVMLLLNYLNGTTNFFVSLAIAQVFTTLASSARILLSNPRQHSKN